METNRQLTANIGNCAPSSSGPPTSRVDCVSRCPRKRQASQAHRHFGSSTDTLGSQRTRNGVVARAEARAITASQSVTPPTYFSSASSFDVTSVYRLCYAHVHPMGGCAGSQPASSTALSCCLPRCAVRNVATHRLKEDTTPFTKRREGNDLLSVVADILTLQGGTMSTGLSGAVGRDWVLAQILKD